MSFDKFNPPLQTDTMDSYQSMQSVRKALMDNLGRFHGTLLDIGCGRMPYRSMLLSPPSRCEKYIGMDLAGTKYGTPDLSWDGVTIPLKSKSIDCVVATEMLEHCPDPSRVLSEICRVLKSKGTLFFTVPFLWPLHDAPHDEYRYTPFALNRHLSTSGFTGIELQSMGGWDASLASMIGLWVRGRSMSNTKRQILSTLALPIVKYLLKRDKPSDVTNNQTMITGISGIAIAA